MARTIRRMLLCPTLCLLSFQPSYGQSDPATNEYRVTIVPSHPITESVTGFGHLSYSNDPQSNRSTYALGYPEISYTARPWFQIWGGVRGIYTDNQGTEDTFELRTFIGPKFFIPNKRKMTIFNYTRYEARNIYDHGAHDWTLNNRIRSRFGAEIPLTSVVNAWKPKTFYTLIDVEPFWQSGAGLNMVRFCAGLAYIPDDHIRLEFIYHTQWGQEAGNDALVYNQNIFRVNIKVGLKHGLLDKVSNPGS